MSINEITKNKEIVHQYKIYTNLNYGRSIDGPPPYKVISDPILGFPQTCCTQSYLVIGGFETQIEAENVISYMETNNYVDTNGDTLGYSRIVYQVKVWGNEIKDLQLYAQQIDNVLRPLGWTRTSSGELFDRESTMCQKIMTYEALGLESF